MWSWRSFRAPPKSGLPRKSLRVGFNCIRDRIKTLQSGPRRCPATRIALQRFESVCAIYPGSCAVCPSPSSEPIARRANREDGCKGHFWEARFKCQTLLDEMAVLSAMTYVDLNPVRAKICDNIEDSAHTSARTRLQTIDQDPGQGASQLAPVLGLRGCAVRALRRKFLTPSRVLFLLTDAASCDSGAVLPAATLQGLVQRRAGPWSGQRAMSPITAHRSVRPGSTGADALS